MRALIAGFGVRGAQWAAELRGARDWEPAGVADPDEAARARAADAGLAVWAGLDEALAAARPDAALVASPPELHADHAVACLEQGIPVLVEKPLAVTLADARRVAEAARAAGVPALVGQNFRLRALERSLRATVARHVGRLDAGAIVSARPAHIGPADVGGQGHAPLWDLGVHHFDLVRRRLGGPPAQVAGSRHGSIYRLALSWADGREVTWWHDEQGAFHHHEWWRGERACLEVRGQRVWLAPQGRRPRPQRRPRGPGAERRLLDALAAAIAGGGGDGLDAHENIATIAIVEAAAAALDRGTAVDLEPEGAT